MTSLEDTKLTASQVQFLDDLRSKAELFDMEVDYETLTLTPKPLQQPPTWLERWIERQNQGDYTVVDNGF